MSWEMYLAIYVTGAVVWDDVTASIECDTGQSYVINHGYVAEILSISEGKANLVIQGEPAVEVTL